MSSRRLGLASSGVSSNSFSPLLKALACHVICSNLTALRAVFVSIQIEDPVSIFASGTVRFLFGWFLKVTRLESSSSNA